MAQLTEDQIDEIAEKAAEKAIKKLTEHVYQEVGRNVISKFFYLVGATVVAIGIYLKAKGIL